MYCNWVYCVYSTELITPRTIVVQKLIVYEETIWDFEFEERKYGKEFKYSRLF